MTERLKRKLLLLHDTASQYKLGNITILKVFPSYSFGRHRCVLLYAIAHRVGCCTLLLLAISCMG